MDHICFAEISWDEEAGVWYVSETEFPGLVAEAASERDLVRMIPGGRRHQVAAHGECRGRAGRLGRAFRFRDMWRWT